MDEKIAVVDELGRIVGSELRSKMAEMEKSGTNEFRRVISGVILFRPNGNILLAKIADSKQKFPGKYSFTACGHVGAGEEPWQTAVRECKEEIGVDVVLDSLICYGRPGKKRFNYVYKAIYDGDDFVLDPAETSEIREFTIAELLEMFENSPDDLVGNLRKSLLYYIDNINV